MRPGYQRVRCVVCGVPREKARNGHISTRGKCDDCSLEAQLVNVAGIAGVTRDSDGHMRVRLKQRTETLAVSESYRHLFKQM